MPSFRPKGFTLAELLIALAILGVIATFTIPKIISAQQNGQYNAIAKEDIAMLSGSFLQYSSQNSVSSNTGISDLTPYMNYASLDTSSVVDADYGYNTFTCGSTANMVCLKLHNGSTLYYWNNDIFGGTGTLNALNVYIDPDGRSDGTTNGPGKSVRIYLYYNSRVSDNGSILPGTTWNNGGTMTSNPFPSSIPPWFSW